MDSPQLYWCFVILIILLTLFCFQSKRKRASAPPLPPGPTAWDIVVNLFQLVQRPHESLYTFSLKYGPPMSFRLGMKTIVVASSAVMAKEILKTHDHIFVGRTVIEAAKVFSHHKSSLGWGEYGPHWRYLRRITAVELFGPQRLEAQERLRRDEVFHIVGLIFENKGKAINIEHMAFCNFMNVLGSMIFGTSLIDPCNSASVGFKDTIENLSDFYPLFRLEDPQGVLRQMAKHLKRLYDFIDLFIQDRIATKNIKHQQNDSDKDFLDILLDARTEDFTLFDVRALISVMVNLWAIGRDPAKWKEPLQFMPERILEGENSEIDYRGHNFEPIPFGAGRRLCVGLPFAMRMIHLVLASLIHSFEWTLHHRMGPEQMDMRDESGSGLKKALELIAIPKPCLPYHVY